MKIAAYYSHLNGLEFLLVHKKSLWNEIKERRPRRRCIRLPDEGLEGATKQGKALLLTKSDEQRNSKRLRKPQMG